MNNASDVSFNRDDSLDNSTNNQKKKRQFKQSRSLGRHHGENNAEASSTLLKNVFSAK
jgi:hypothetical protein